MPRRDQLFESITTEGALLPSDFINRLAQRDREIPGLSPEAYHLGSGEKLNEAISRSWNRVLAVWKSFAPAMLALPESDAGTTLTREKWLLPLFQELGYGRLQTTKPFEFEERRYSISHGWLNTPIHLVSFRADLDARSEHIAGARSTSPHSMVQELLNRSTPHLWGMVSNGLRLRLLRDNVSLTRQAYVEFDLEAMMQGELYADFAVLWLLLHQSRVEGERSELCWLEKWTQEARQRGARALDQLRNGVEDAITALGSGFLAHPANTALRDKLTTGTLSKQDYFRQLLRVVYRFLFLFAAEDRELLFADNVPAATREKYLRHYSASRLRRIANRLGGTQHADLWHNVRLVFRWLGSDEGCPALGLPALGSFLWSARATPDLDDCFISNRDLLAAIRALAFVEHKNVRRPIDYKNIGTEEIGSVYESLLEQHPDLHVPTAKFTLGTHAGNERKTTGTHYTPPSLVNCLLDSALEPVLQERVRDFAKLGLKSAEEAILSMKVCDPACGSGHFLIGAAHRMAKRLAAIRTGDAEPAPVAIRHALRDVIGRCLYGVDINPMAVELCKFALWIEALEPGKPLSFLDHHIQCGNALLGATPALMAKGIPDAAFEPIEGDDRNYCTNFKRENRRELRQESLFDREHRPWEHLGNLTVGIAQLASLPDDSVADVHAKEKIYAELVRSSSYESGQQLADAWCAAFVWKKCPPAAGGFDYPITNDIFQRLERNPHDAPSWMREEIKRQADLYQFLHWHLAFPDVFRVPGKNEKAQNESHGWNGGFDCILGNPPWDMVELSEKEYFASRQPLIAEAPSARQRQQLIQALASSEPLVFAEFTNAKRQVYGTRQFVQSSGRFPYSSTGRINLYPLFVENTVGLTAKQGRSGIIVPSAISMDAYNAPLFRWLVEQRRLVSLFDFDNTQGFFPDVDSRYRFCLLTSGGSESGVARFDFCFYAHDTAELSDTQRRIALTPEEIYSFSPNTLAPPMFLNSTDARIAKRTYEECGVLHNDKSQTNLWGVAIQRMLSLSDPGDLFRKSSELSEEDTKRVPAEWVRLFSGKAIHQFEHRYATYELRDWRAVAEKEVADPTFAVRTEYYVRTGEVQKRLAGKEPSKWLLVYRDVTNATNERTAMAAIIPPTGCDTTCRNIFSSTSSDLLICFLPNVNSVPFDYFTRQKVIGMHLGAGVFEQLPVLPPATYKQLAKWSDNSMKVQDWLLSRVLELTYTAWDLEPFALDCGWSGPPFRWNEERRFLLRCELDAAFLHLYSLNRDDTAYILDTFPIVKRKDEEKYNGDYRTKRVILEIYDAMKSAMDSGQPYETRLDPPPASIRVAHPFDWSRQPFAVPDEPRVAFTPAENYAPAVMLELVFQSNGSLPWEKLRRAWRLLANPTDLARRAESDFGPEAKKWKQQFNDKLALDDLVDTLSGFCHAGTLWFGEREGVKVVEFSDETDYHHFAHVRCDARIALAVAPTLPDEPSLPTAQTTKLETASRR